MGEKLMKEKFNVLVLDTETHFKSIYNKMVFDIGWTVGDVRSLTAPKKEKQFYIKEFLKPSMWNHTYLDKKSGKRKFWYHDLRADEVLEKAHSQKDKIVSWNEILEELKFDISLVEGVGSYNWTFDRGAIEDTSLKLNHETFLSHLDFRPFCIQDMYVNKVINRDYFDYIDNEISEDEKELFKSKSGKNLGYSAEIMARYIHKFLGYIEAHTSLEDATIETELTRIFCQKYWCDFRKNFLGNPKNVSWTVVRKRLSSAEKMRKRG